PGAPEETCSYARPGDELLVHNTSVCYSLSVVAGRTGPRNRGRAAARSRWSPWRRHGALPTLIVPTAASTGPAPRPPATGMVTWTARSAPASERHHRGGGGTLGAAAPTVLTGESAQSKIASVGPRGGWSRRRGARPPPDALQVM